jgi:hypothetical protein
MSEGRIIGWILLGIAGLAVAVALSLAASTLSTQPIGLSGEPLRAGERLAPPSATSRRTTSTARKRTSTAKKTTPAPTQTAPAPTVTATSPTTTTSSGDDHGGRSRGGSGGSGGGGHGSDD